MNYKETDYSIAHFHIGKGGRFNNPGHETFVALEDLSRVISKSDVTLNNQDEDGNALPDEDWTLVDSGGNVILTGKDEIESPTGCLDFDRDYDTDICRRISGCDDDELCMLLKALMKGDETHFTEADCIVIADCSDASDLSGAKVYKDEYDEDASPEILETTEDIAKFLITISKYTHSMDEEETEGGEEIMVIRSFSSAVPDYYIFND